MAKEYTQGIFIPENPDKYIGDLRKPIIYRSGWELSVFLEFDRNPSIIAWGSESIQIPYFNPFTRTWTVYIPDLIAVYDDADGIRHTEIIEVKPLKETGLIPTKSPRDRAAIALNHCKWQAAEAYCRKEGLTFRLMTERDIYVGAGRQKPTKPRASRKRKK